MGQNQSQKLNQNKGNVNVPNSTKENSDENSPHFIQHDVEKIEGFQVMRVLPRGPAADAGLCPYFDFITHISNHNLAVATLEETPMALFKRKLAEHYNTLMDRRNNNNNSNNATNEKVVVEEPLPLIVYNLRCRCYRQLTIFFHLQDKANNGQAPKGGLLGCSIEWRSAKDAILRGSFHILEILPNSPFDMVNEDLEPNGAATNNNNNNNNNNNHANNHQDNSNNTTRKKLVMAERDYIIGMQSSTAEMSVSMLKGEKDMHERLETWRAFQAMCIDAHQKAKEREQLGLTPANITSAANNNKGKQGVVEIPRYILFLVYNSEEKTVQELAIDMGTKGDNPLGARIASGMLHVIPPLPPPSANNSNNNGENGTEGAVLDEAELPRMSRFYLPRNFKFETDYSSAYKNQSNSSNSNASNSVELGTPTPAMLSFAPADVVRAQLGNQLSPNNFNQGKAPSYSSLLGLGPESSIASTLPPNSHDHLSSSHNHNNPNNYSNPYTASNTSNNLVPSYNTSLTEPTGGSGGGPHAFTAAPTPNFAFLPTSANSSEREAMLSGLPPSSLTPQLSGTNKISSSATSNAPSETPTPALRTTPSPIFNNDSQQSSGNQHNTCNNSSSVDSNSANKNTWFNIFNGGKSFKDVADQAQAHVQAQSQPLQPSVSPQQRQQQQQTLSHQDPTQTIEQQLKQQQRVGNPTKSTDIFTHHVPHSHSTDMPEQQQQLPSSDLSHNNNNNNSVQVNENHHGNNNNNVNPNPFEAPLPPGQTTDNAESPMYNPFAEMSDPPLAAAAAPTSTGNDHQGIVANNNNNNNVSPSPRNENPNEGNPNTNEAVRGNRTPPPFVPPAGVPPQYIYTAEQNHEPQLPPSSSSSSFQPKEMTVANEPPVTTTSVNAGNPVLSSGNRTNSNTSHTPASNNNNNNNIVVENIPPPLHFPLFSEFKKK